MSGGIYPKARVLVPGILRSLGSIVLILVAAACGYLSLAATEAPRDVWWRFWTIYGVVGLSCLLGAGWLLRRSPSSVVLNLIAAVCVILPIGVLDGPREYWWTLSILAVVGLSCLLRAGWLLRVR
jgi:multisubunit Na+/H+ antiporter MnhB subunit